MNEDKLPAVKVLISDGLNYLKLRSDLVILLALPLLVFTVLEYLNKNLPFAQQEPKFLILSGLVSLVALVFNFLIIGAALYSVVRSEEERVGLRAGLNWSRNNILGIIWVYGLSSLAILGGFLLLIIPGLIIALYVYFPQYVYVNEGLKGLAALRRSHDLVKGNWWNLLNKLVKIGFLVIIILIVLGIITGLIQKIFSALPTIDLFILLVAQVFSAAVTLFGFTVGNTLYKNLVAIEVERVEEIAPVANWKYLTLIVLGLLSLVLLVAAVGFVLKDGLPPQNNEDRVKSGIEAKQKMQELRLDTGEGSAAVNS